MNKKNTISIVVLIILLGLFVYTKVNNHTEKTINFFKADSASVAKIILSSKDDTLIVVKNGKEWQLEFPVKYKIQDHKIKDIYSILKVKTSNLPISESKDKLKKYSVTDSLGYRVQIFDKSGKLLDDVIIGKSKNYSFANGRKYNSNKVYQLEKNIYWQIKPEAKLWRDKTIYKTKEDNIAGFKVKIKNNQYTVTAKDTLWVYKKGKKTVNIDKKNSKIKSMLRTLTNLTAADFIDNDYKKYEDNFKKPYAQIEIDLQDGGKVLYTIIQDESKSKYILMKDDNKITLFRVYKSFIDRFDKKPKDFKK